MNKEITKQFKYEDLIETDPKPGFVSRARIVKSYITVNGFHFKPGFIRFEDEKGRLVGASSGHVDNDELVIYTQDSTGNWDFDFYELKDPNNKFRYIMEELVHIGLINLDLPYDGHLYYSHSTVICNLMKELGTYELNEGISTCYDIDGNYWVYLDADNNVHIIHIPDGMDDEELYTHLKAELAA